MLIRCAKILVCAYLGFLISLYVLHKEGWIKNEKIDLTLLTRYIFINIFAKLPTSTHFSFIVTYLYTLTDKVVRLSHY